MHAFLCRVMAFVFILNCLCPASNAWAAGSSASINEQVQARLEKTVSEQLQESISQAAEQYQQAETMTDLKEAIINLHHAMDQKAAQEQNSADLQKLMRDTPIAPNSTIRSEVRKLPVPQTTEKNEVLEKLAKNQLTLIDMLEYIDPFDPAQYNVQNIIYAGEILGNSFDNYLSLGAKESLAEISQNALLAQLRILYRLNQLTQKTPSTIYEVMAIGTLRITLWKIHTFYVQTNQADPLITPLGNDQTASSFIVSSPKTEDGPVSFRFSNSSQPKGSFVLPPNVYQAVNQQFRSELEALKATNPQPGSLEMQMITVLADYAASYALIQSPNNMVSLVKMFDSGAERSFKGNVQPGLFNQPYNPVLNMIFITMFETVKYLSSDSALWNQAIVLLKDFSDPAKYALSTRLFALETASLLYQYNELCQTPKGTVRPSYPVFLRCNTGDTSDPQLRALFAARTVDMYAPLNNTSSAAMKDYGLDSQQMKMLSDKLAFIYNGFANDELKWDTSRPRMNHSYSLDQDANGKTRILNGKNSVPRLVPLNQGQQFLLPDGTLTTISGFGRTSDGKWIEMQLRNGLNRTKVADENTSAFFSFVGEAVFWVYGGEIFRFIGVAYRTAKGAVLSLPSAVKAATTANKGRRALAFSIEIQKGARFANLQKDLAKNGVVLAMERVAEQTVTGKNKKMPVTSSYAPQMKTNTEFIYSQHGLQGQYSKWNPKRWLGLTPSEVNRIHFTQSLPGFGVETGSAYVGGTSLSKGVKSWDDWRKLRSRFRAADDPTRHAFPQFFDYATRKDLWDEINLTQTFNKAAKHGAFNVWVPIKTTLSGADDTLPVLAKNKASGETIQWWNLTRLGKPTSPLAWGEDFSGVWITPATSRATALKAGITPASLNGVELSAAQILNNTWQTSVMPHYFSQINRQGLGKYILPKYIPNANYWNTVKSNWRFGFTFEKELLANNNFWRSFKNSMFWFGSYAVTDAMIYPMYAAWNANALQKDEEKTLAQFGDAFDPKKLEEDAKAAMQSEQKSTRPNWLLGNLKQDLLDQVLLSQRTSTAGTTFSLPLQSLRHDLLQGIAPLSFVSQQEEAQLATTAVRLQMGRALREQKETIKKQRAEELALWKKETLAQILNNLKDNKEVDIELFSFLGGESTKKEIVALYQQYTTDITKVFEEGNSPEEIMVQSNQLMDQLTKDRLQKQEEISRLRELLINQEEYIPDYGYFFEETPTSAN